MIILLTIILLVLGTEHQTALRTIDSLHDEIYILKRYITELEEQNDFMKGNNE